MSTHDPKRYPDGSLPANDANDANDENAEAPLFAPELRAALRRDLGPAAGDRARVRAALMSTLSTGTISPVAERVDALMQGKAAAATATASATKAAAIVGTKTAAAAGGVVHSLATKLLVASLVVGGGATAVVMRAPHPSTVEAPSAAVAPTTVSGAQPRINAIESTESIGAREAAPATPAAVLPRAVEVQQHQAVQAPELNDEPVAAAGSADDARASHRRRTAASTRMVRRSGRSVTSATAQPGHAAMPITEAPEQAPEPSVERQPAAVAEAASNPPSQPTANAVPAEAQSSAAPLKAAEPSLPGHQLSAELALVRTATVALRDGAPDKALASLRKHAEQFPEGALRTEAQALRAMALCALRDPSAANVSDKFLHAHPGSALAQRVRAACTKP